MHKAVIWIIAILLLAAGYPFLRQQFGGDWQYFFVVAAILLLTRHIAKKFGK